MRIEGEEASQLLAIPDWMSIFYETPRGLYLCSVWNHSAAYYEVLIRLTPEETARCRSEGVVYMTALARSAINNGSYSARFVRDYTFTAT